MSDENAQRFKEKTYSEELQRSIEQGYRPNGMYLISQEDEGQGIIKKPHNDPTYFANVPEEWKRQHISQELEKRSTGEMANCINSLSECYPHGLPPGNSTFMSDPLKYGFKEISYEDKEPGDLIQYMDDNKPHHAMIFNGYNEDGEARFNYSNGGDKYKVNGRFLGPLFDYKAYRYVGTPQDSINWFNEYNNQNK